MRGRFLLAVGTELGLLLVILGVTAALVDEAPAKSVITQRSPAQSTTFTATRPAGPFRTALTLHPARVGTNTVDMRVTSARHLRIGEVDLAAVPPQSGLNPVNLNVVQLSASRFRVLHAPLRLAGRWELEVTVRHGLTEWLARIPVTIAAVPR